MCVCVSVCECVSVCVLVRVSVCVSRCVCQRVLRTSVYAEVVYSSLEIRNVRLDTTGIFQFLGRRKREDSRSEVRGNRRQKTVKREVKEKEKVQEEKGYGKCLTR